MIRRHTPTLETEASHAPDAEGFEHEQPSSMTQTPTASQEVELHADGMSERLARSTHVEQHVIRRHTPTLETEASHAPDAEGFEHEQPSSMTQTPTASQEVELHADGVSERLARSTHVEQRMIRRHTPTAPQEVELNVLEVADAQNQKRQIMRARKP